MVTLGGVRVTADVQRVNNQLVVSVGGAKIVLGAVDDGEGAVELDSDGSLVVADGSSITISSEGFMPQSKAQFWLYSEPHFLGESAANDSGRLDGTLKVPAGLENGSHRLVLEGKNSEGEPLHVTFGVRKKDQSSSIGLAPIVFVVLMLGVLSAVFLPAASRKRKRSATSS